MRWRPSLLLVSFLCSIGLNSNETKDAPAWNLPRFGADAATLYQAASSAAAKPGTDVIVLDEEDGTFSKGMASQRAPTIWSTKS